jgi:muconate cycloisomerase
MIKLKNIKLYQMKIPFNFSFGHGTTSRKTSDSLIVKLESNEGLLGYGEGLPREYVTGETPESSTQFFKSFLSPALEENSSFSIKKSDSLEDILNYISLHFFKNINFEADDKISYNSIKCATEMAIIDLILQFYNKRINELLIPTNKVNYSCVLPFIPLKYFGLVLRYLKLFKFNQIKVKTNAKDDDLRLKKIRNILGEKIELRIDGNSIYEKENFSKDLKIFKKHKVDWIEQPFHKEKHNDIVSHFTQRDIPFMADESLCTLKDGSTIIENKTFDLFNLRISKNGGLKDSLALFKMAKESGLGYQVGAQVGETALLSSLGRSFAYHINPMALEGSAGTLLLQKDISKENVRFKSGGKTSTLNGGPHFELTMKPYFLDRYGILVHQKNIT